MLSALNRSGVLTALQKIAIHLFLKKKKACRSQSEKPFLMSLKST